MPACIRLETVKCKRVEKPIQKNDKYIRNFSLKFLVTSPVFMTSFAVMHVQTFYQIVQLLTKYKLEPPIADHLTVYVHFKRFKLGAFLPLVSV